MQSGFPMLALLKTTSAYESSLHLICKNIQKGSSTNSFSNSSHTHKKKMIHDLTFPTSCHQVSKTLKGKREKDERKEVYSVTINYVVNGRWGKRSLILNPPGKEWCWWTAEGPCGCPRSTSGTTGWTFQGGRMQLNTRKNFQILGNPKIDV